ncbi:MAG: cell division protein ZipA [Kangiellaceae bacterium]|nr:cell division protein ZipA [Kangiellaceae bacterium]
MDWQIRITILIAGLILVGYIYWDFTKKKKIQKANEKLKRQFGNISNQVDRSGFDLDGVGQARAAGDAIDGVENYTKESAPIESEVKTKTDSVGAKPSIRNASTRTVPGETIDQFIQSSQQESESNSLGNTKKSQDFFESNELDEPSEESAQNPLPELVFSLILQAEVDSQYTGRDFLPILLSQGLRHGDMGIFHRHQKHANVSIKAPGPVLFSLANAIAPGTFNVDNLDRFQTPALTLFMTLPGPKDAQIAYSAMVKTARLIVTELGGVILDESQSAYSEQTHNHRLDQIQEYNRKSMS